MLNLLAKDFKLLFGKEKSIARRIATILVTLIFIACFIAIEVFLFTTILNKISSYRNINTNNYCKYFSSKKIIL